MKVFQWLILSALLFAIGVGLVFGSTPLPFKNMSEAPQFAVSAPEPTGPICVGKANEVDELYLVALDVNGEHYKFLFPDDPGLFILFSVAEGDNTPVWIGRVEKDGNLVVDREITYSELRSGGEEIVCGAKS